MKLELKHIAPYLPYGLKALNTFGDIVEMLGLQKGSDSVDNLLWAFIKDKKYMKGYDYQCKPILRPLSDLTKEIEHNGEKECVLDEIYNRSWMALGYILEEDEYGYHLLSKEDNSEIHIDPNKPHTLMQWIYEILIEYKFDVFGLIDQGLAIDVNSIEDNPYK